MPVTGSKFVKTLAAIPIDRFIISNSLSEEQSFYAVDVEDAFGDQSFPLPPNPSVVILLRCKKLHH